MIVYWSMFIYVALFGWIIQNYYKNRQLKTKYDSKMPLIGAMIVLALPVFLIGMRSSYGDTWAYISSFNGLTTDFSQLWSERKEVKGFGFDVYQYIIKRFISDDYNVYLMITAIIQATAIMKIYYKFSSDFTYSVLLFFFSMCFTNMMNGMRQFLAASVIFLFSEFLFEKKTIRFLLVVLLAITIHISAVVWIPIFFVVQGKPWNFKIIASMVAIVLAIFAVDSFTNLLSDTLEGTNYEGYTDQFAEDDGANIVHTLIAAVPTVLALWKRKAIDLKNNKVIFIIINCSVVEVLLNLLAKFTSGILIGRLPSYFSPLTYVLYPWIFDNVIEEKDRRLIKSVCMVFYILYAAYYMTFMGMTYFSEKLEIRV